MTSGNFNLRYMDYVFGDETEARTFAKAQGWEVNYVILISDQYTSELEWSRCLLNLLHFLD